MNSMETFSKLHDYAISGSLWANVFCVCAQNLPLDRSHQQCDTHCSELETLWNKERVQNQEIVSVQNIITLLVLHTACVMKKLFHSVRKIWAKSAPQVDVVPI